MTIVTLVSLNSVKRAARQKVTGQALKMWKIFWHRSKTPACLVKTPFVQCSQYFGNSNVVLVSAILCLTLPPGFDRATLQIEIARLFVYEA